MLRCEIAIICEKFSEEPEHFLASFLWLLSTLCDPKEVLNPAAVSLIIKY